MRLALLLAALWAVVGPFAVAARQARRAGTVEDFSGWRTNFEKRLVELGEFAEGGPGKDGIPAITKPDFVTVEAARSWLGLREPVISVVLDGEARAYPLQILIWHEIVNDRLAGRPIAVTFCPLCYSAVVFERTVRGRTHVFGVSGLLRHADLVMYDRETESFWQQLTGEAIVGDLTGARLRRVPAQIISFQQFAATHGNGRVLSRDTGYQRAYGANPYVGYDDVSGKPWFEGLDGDERLRPMEKVVTVSAGQTDRAYPYSVTQKLRVINDEIAGRPIVVFHAEGALSVLDQFDTNSSREVGSTGVFDPRVDGQKLSFAYAEGRFTDNETGSAWNITGKALSGPSKGKQLRPILHGDYFAFAWFAFKPQTEVYREEEAAAGDEP
jgi:hypothetical protein